MSKRSDGVKMVQMHKRREMAVMPGNYAEILNDVKSILENTKYRAYKAVDNLRVQAYWQIGGRIVREELQHKERADYGKRLIERLAGDLAMGKVNLHYMVRFYIAYPIIQTVSEQLSWSHLVELIHIENKEKRRFYEHQIIQNAWSVRELREQLLGNPYGRMETEGKLAVVPKPRQVLPENIFKDSYNFDFLGPLPGGHSEEDLKEALMDRIGKFIQELGSDFFVGKREVPLLIGGQYYRIDMELFHAALLCYVIVEIKTEPFKPAFVGQMNAYLNWYKENKWTGGQRCPIGLIICKTKNAETVHYALGDLKKDIFVSECKVKLPSEEEIKKALVMNG